MNILVLGASGMAGHVIATYLEERGHSVATIASQHQLNPTTKLIDVTDGSKFLKELDDSDYDAVINCIGVLVRESEVKKDEAIYLNSYLPMLLEKYYHDTLTKVVHISSDGVFSGLQTKYQENSLYDSQSFYGRSKALGEINTPKDLTIRTSIFGPELSVEGPSLFNWLYRQTGEIDGYTNALWKGVSTIELAKAIEAALRQNISGIYHLVPASSISKFDLLSLFKKVFQRGKPQIIPALGTGTNANLLNTREDFIFELPDYPTMVKDMLAWVRSHEKLYPHYRPSISDT